MSSFLDVIAALLIFSVVLIMSLQLNIFVLEKNSQNVLRTANQEKITGTESYVGLGGTIERDLSRIGAGDSVSPSIVVADSDRVVFRGDVDDDGTVDSLRYFVTTPPALPPGSNPNLKYLYRRQNTQTGTSGWVGVSAFKLSYLDERGRALSVPVPDSLRPSIRSVRVKMMLESALRVKNDYDTTFAASYWETLVSPVNVK